ADNGSLLGTVGGKHCLLQPAVFPFQTDRNAPLRAKAPDSSVRKPGRQSGHEPDFLRRALQEHFRDSGCGTEISVDLKGRMSVEQVWIGAPAIAVIEVIAVFRFCRLFSRRDSGSGNEAELLCQHPEGMIPVLKSGPDVYLPSKA